MGYAIFPDGGSAEAGWTPRNMALKRHGHDVGPNAFDIIIHFDSCGACARAAEDRETAQMMLDFDRPDLSPAEREFYGFPSRADIRWAKRLLAGGVR